MKNLTRFAAALACCAALFAVQPLTAQEEDAAEPITIGVAGPFTGPNAQFGIQIRAGVEQGVREINEAGGIDGRMIKTVIADDAGIQTEANKVALKLAGNDDLVAVIGHFNSSCSLAGRGIYKDAGLLMFSPASTNATVTIDHPNVFRNIFTDRFQGHSMADLIKNQLGFTRVAILHDNDDYGKGLADFFAEKADEIGLKIVDTKAYDRETTDFRPTLQALVKRKPQAIVIAGLYQQAGLIAKQVREQGIPLPLVGSDGVFSDKFIEIAGKAAEGTLVSTPFLFDESDARGMAFFEAVADATGKDPDAWAALSYDAFMIIAEAIDEVGPDRAAIIEYISNYTTIDNAFDGMTGKTYFDENGDCVKPVNIAVVKSGKFRKFNQ